MLNPHAQVFVPSSSSGPASHPVAVTTSKGNRRSRKHEHKHQAAPSARQYAPAFNYYDVDMEDHVTEEELEELEACEEWVRTMAQLEELEREHIMTMALSLAPQETVEEIERRAVPTAPGLSRKSSKGKNKH